MNYTILIADIFQDIVGDDYRERTISFTLSAIVRGSTKSHLISCNATFMSVLNRNVDEWHPIHIFVAIEEVVTGDVSPPIRTFHGFSRCTVEEIPDVA